MPVVAANTRAFVHVKRLDGQVPEMLPQHSCTAATSGWDTAVLCCSLGWGAKVAVCDWKQRVSWGSRK